MLDRRRILVIEDDPVTRNGIAEILSRDYWLTYESTAQDALDELNGLPFDLVILDLDLCALGGEEALLRIRALDCCDEIPIIALSECPEFRLLLRGYGVQMFLDKPLAANKLREAIRRLFHPARMPWQGRRATDVGLEVMARD